MIEIIDCQQGTPEWLQARLGIPTASCFDTIMAQGRGGGESKTRRTYMLKLIGERLTGQPSESYSNVHMERGKTMEEEARDMYAFQKDTEPKQIGFIRNGDIGCSPDSLLGIEGTLEIKTKLPHLQLEVLLANKLPAEHVAQVQGQIMVSERYWCDFVSYWPGLPLFVTRVFRDDDFIKKLRDGIDAFLSELTELQRRIEEMKG